MALITQREHAFKDVLENKESFGTALMAVLIDQYSTDFFDWDPKALYMQIMDDFHVDTPDINKDKIGAMLVSLTTNQFFQNSDMFASICKALSSSGVDFGVFSPATPEEMSWGVTEVLLNNPPDPERGNDSFSDEVAAFVGMMLTQQGVLNPPNTLQFAIYPTNNPVEDIELMFADDPVMFEAAMKNQLIAKQEVEQNTKETLSMLKRQLSLLPISKKTEGAE